MARDNLLTGSQIAGFKGIELHEVIKVITDARGPRVVVHEFPYRDGAKIEVLGRKPHRTTFNMTFTGADWINKLKQLVKSIDDNPAGLLVHPIYGQMQVVCEGIPQHVVNIPEALDTVDVQIVFVEDQLDLGITEQQGLSAYAQKVTSDTATFQLLAADYKAQQTLDQVGKYVSLVTSYASEAYVAASTNTIDPSLQVQLDAVEAQLELTFEALQADPLALDSVAQVYDVLAQAQVVFASCLDLADEVFLETSGYFSFTTSGPTSAAVLLGSIYKSAALAVLDEFLRLNADKFTDATKIPANLDLIMPPIPTGATPAIPGL